MSPIRKTDDYRSVQIDSWDEYIEEEIVAMHERGEMENLPLQGKPLNIWKTDINPEYDLAFSRLKNAGVKPMWMELDQEIANRTEELWAKLGEIESKIRSLIEQIKTPIPVEPLREQSRWQKLRSWFRQDYSDDAPPPPTMTSITSTRERERTKFLELAAELDKKIASYHDSLPKGAEHLQRLRWLPERAARIFDDRIALTSWWEEPMHG